LKIDHLTLKPKISFTIIPSGFFPFPHPICGEWAEHAGCSAAKSQRRGLGSVVVDAKHIPDGFQITHAVHCIWLQIAAFGPFVPGIDCQNPGIAAIHLIFELL
jgi:hypothetical protein